MMTDITGIIAMLRENMERIEQSAAITEKQREEVRKIREEWEAKMAEIFAETRA